MHRADVARSFHVFIFHHGTGLNVPNAERSVQVVFTMKKL